MRWSPRSRREVQALDPTLPLYNVRTLADQRDGSLHTERVAAAMLTLFGAVALTLAAVGPLRRAVLLR